MRFLTAVFNQYIHDPKDMVIGWAVLMLILTLFIIGIMEVCAKRKTN